MKVKAKISYWTCCSCAGMCCAIITSVQVVSPKMNPKAEEKVKQFVVKEFGNPECPYANVQQAIDENIKEMEIEIPDEVVT